MLVATGYSETVRWNVQARFGLDAAGLQRAIDAAEAHFRKSPNDIVVLELDAGRFLLEDAGARKGTLDLSGIEPGPHGRLIVHGKGMEKTTLVFADNKHALYGRNVYRITFADMHMTRDHYTVSQGIVVDVGPGKVVLDIQDGFPTPQAIFNPLSDQGRFLQRYTNSRTDPQIIQEDNAQIPWTHARRLFGNRWELTLKPRKLAPGYKPGDLIGIKSKHSQSNSEFDGQAYWFYGGADFRFERVKWTHKSRGVFRGGFEHVQIVECVIDRAPPIEGQTPCLATPGGGPQIGQPNDPPTAGHLVANCRFIATGDDAVALFNATGTIHGCFIRDSFVRGILVSNAPQTVLENNTVLRCPIQVSKDWRFHPRRPTTAGFEEN
ncbi:hypothetical protein JCM19992_31350 [Thermostilla marina]